MEKIRCAIAGLGRIGSSLEDDSRREKPASHAGAVSLNEDCVLVAGCDSSEKKIEEFGRRWNCSAIYTSFEVMLSNEIIDILHVATPPETHLPIVKAAIEKKVPVIICEKPISHNIDTAKELLEVCRAGDSKVLVNHERRYSLQFARFKEIIESNVYGRLISLTCRLYMGRNRAAGEMLLDDGTHMIDLIRYLAGEIDVEHVSGSFDRPSNARIVMSAGGVPAFFEIGSFRDHIVFELDGSFEFGRVMAGNGVYDEFVSTESPFYERMRSLVRKDVSFPRTEYFKRMLEDAVHSFREKDHSPVSSIYDGYRAIEVIDEIVRFNSGE